MTVLARLGGVLIAVLLASSGDARGESSSLSSLPGYDQYNGVVSDGRDGFFVVGAQETEKQGETVGSLVHFGPDRTHRLDATLRPGGALSAALADVVRLDGGDVVAAGWVRPSGATTDVCWIVRISPNGQQRWSRTSSGSSHERCYFITQLPDGALLTGGRREDDASGKGSARGTTWRVDATTGDFGRPTDVGCEGGATRCAFQDAAAFPDGSTVLVGWLTQAGRGDDDIWVVRRDTSGKQTYSRQIGGPGTDLANAALAAADGRAVVVGYTTKAGAKAASGVVIALASNGATAWSREFDVGTAGSDKLLSGIIRPDGTVIAVGAASEGEKAPFKGWVVQLSPDGAPVGERVFDEPTGGRFNAVAADGVRTVAVGAARGAGAEVDGWIAWLDLPARPAEPPPVATLDPASAELLAAIRAQPARTWPETDAYRAAMQAMEEERYSEAAQALTPLAEQGDANAQRALANLFAFGLGVQQDGAKSWHWRRTAALQGHRDAAFDLSMELPAGKEQLAFQLWQLLADEGSADAQTTLGGAYSTGMGVPRNLAEAAVWYGRASDQGDPEATKNLMSLHDGSIPDGLPADAEKVQALRAKLFAQYKALAEKDDPGGYYARRVALFLEADQGVAANLAEAKAWYRRAAAKGDTIASVYLAELDAAEREEERQRQAAAMQDYKRLRDATVRDRLVYAFGKHGNLAIEETRLNLLGSLLTNYAAVLRVKMASGNKAQADWPLRLQLEHEGSIAKPGWFIVSGELAPDSAPETRDGLPVGTLTVMEALPCEQEACSSPNDLIAIIRFWHGMAHWEPEGHGR